jgi:hypothetical protein
MPNGKNKKKSKVAQRPAETGGLAGAVTLLVAKVLGVDDPTTLVATGIVVGCIPAAITFIVTKVREA